MFDIFFLFLLFVHVFFVPSMKYAEQSYRRVSSDLGVQPVPVVAPAFEQGQMGVPVPVPVPAAAVNSFVPQPQPQLIAGAPQFMSGSAVSSGSVASAVSGSAAGNAADEATVAKTV